MKATSVNSVDILYLLSMKISCLISVLALQYYITRNLTSSMLHKGRISVRHWDDP